MKRRSGKTGTGGMGDSGGDRHDVLDAMGAAEFLGAHVETIRRMARKGKIPAYKMGKDWRFRRSDLDAWARTQPRRERRAGILVVDDDRAVRKMIRMTLEQEGYEVHTAVNGLEGLACLAGQRIDLILLDLKMPEMNGPAFLRRIREDGRTCPVIVITGYPDGDLMVEAMETGAFTLLAKPVKRDFLKQAVGGALNGTKGVAGGI
jgi:excisionase family DNA binding protein